MDTHYQCRVDTIKVDDFIKLHNIFLASVKSPLFSFETMNSFFVKKIKMR